MFTHLSMTGIIVVYHLVKVLKNSLLQKRGLKMALMTLKLHFIIINLVDSDWSKKSLKLKKKQVEKDSYAMSRASQNELMKEPI